MPPGRRRGRKKDPRRTVAAQNHLWKLSLVRSFVAKHGWKRLGKSCVVPPGVDIGTWVCQRRFAYRHDRLPDWLATECEKVPGWSWDPVRDAQRRTIDRVRDLVRRYGWDEFPRRADFNLSRWLLLRRQEHRRRKLARWIADALQAIPGWTWEPKRARYARNLRELRGYVERHGWESINSRTRSRNGVAIGVWVNHIRAQYRRGIVPAWLAAGLEAIPGWVWDPRESRQRTRLAQLSRYVEKNGWSKLSKSSVVRGVPLGVWVASCRRRFANGTLSLETRRGLERISGWRWSGRIAAPPPRNRSGRFAARKRR